MIRSILKLIPACQIVTKKILFRWAALGCPGLDPGPGIVFYMLQAMYLHHTSDPEAPTDVSGHPRWSRHRAVTSRTPQKVRTAPTHRLPLMMVCW